MQTRWLQSQPQLFPLVSHSATRHPWFTKMSQLTSNIPVVPSCGELQVQEKKELLGRCLKCFGFFFGGGGGAGVESSALFLGAHPTSESLGLAYHMMTL